MFDFCYDPKVYNNLTHFLYDNSRNIAGGNRTLDPIFGISAHNHLAKLLLTIMKEAEYYSNQTTNSKEDDGIT